MAKYSLSLLFRYKKVKNQINNIIHPKINKIEWEKSIWLIILDPIPNEANPS